MKIRFLILLLALSSIALASEFNFRIREDLGSLDWGYGEVNHEVILQIMEGLTSIGNDGVVAPAIAAHWNYNASQKQYTFELKKNAKWSDGKSICAQDFKDAWLRVLDPAMQSPFAHYLFEIENAELFYLKKIKNSELIGIHTKGCHRLTVSLENKNSYFPSLLSHWIYFPIRNDLIKLYKKHWTDQKNLVTNGPYRLEKWEKDSKYVLSKNLKYYGWKSNQKRDAPDKITAFVISDDQTSLNLFLSKQLDFIRDLPFYEKQKLSKSNEYRSFPSFIGYHIGFRSDFSRNLRCAILHSINTDEIPKVLKGQETPAYSILPQTLESTFKSNFYNSEQAKKLWNADVKKIDINFYAKDIHTPLMEWLQIQLEKNLNVKVGLTKSDSKIYWSTLQKNPPQIFLSGTTAYYVHPYSFLKEFLESSPANWGKISSDKYKKSVLNVSSKINAQLRAKDIQTAENELIQNLCAVVPLYFRQTVALISNQWEGFFINPLTYVYLKDLRMKPLQRHQE